MPVRESAGRFAGWAPLRARLLLALLLAAILGGAGAAALAPGRDLPLATGTASRDADLYRDVAARVGAGEGYYRAAADLHRERRYPLRPFVAVRPPTLASVTAALGADGIAWLHRLLGLAAIGGLALRLRTIGVSGPGRAAAALLGAAAIVPIVGEGMAPWHEAWAALLMLLSLCARGRQRWGASVLLGFAAVLIRELCLPFLGAMLVSAWRDGARREAAAWGAAIAAAAGAIALHAHNVALVTGPGDLRSQGWSALGGWDHLVTMVRQCTPLVALPRPAVAALVPVAIFGWCAVRHPLAERVLLLLVGYGGAFAVLGRPDNFYWGLLLAPLLMPGFALAPGGVRDLVRAATRGSCGSAPAARSDHGELAARA